MTNIISALVLLQHGGNPPDVPFIRYTKHAAPGVTYMQEVDTQIPRVVHILKFKYPSKNLTFRTAIAGDAIFQTSGRSLEKTSSIAMRKHAFAAINSGFFFSNGDPVGLIISGSELISEPYPTRSTAAWSNAAMRFDRPVFKGFLKSGDGNVFTVDGVNRVGHENEIVLFTPKGNRAKIPAGGMLLLFSTEKKLTPNRTIEIKYWQSVSQSEDFQIPAGHFGFVVSQKKVPDIVPELAAGSKWKLRVQLSGTTNWTRMSEAVGGGPCLVKNGSIALNAQQELFKPEFYAVRHPRTAIGLTKNRECIWVVVDGRQPFSAGASLDELANLMLKLGCVDAINLDGGGSSTFFLDNQVINRPSDGFERPVSDAALLFVDSSDPPARPFRIKASARRISVGAAIRLKAVTPSGAPIPQDQVLWACSDRSAWVDQGGFLHGLAPGTAAVSARWKGSVRTETFIIR